jgi:hypothetical protein
MSETYLEIKGVIPFHTANVKEGIIRMLDCVLSSDKKYCNKCQEVNACSFLTEAVFVHHATKGLITVPVKKL